MKRTFSLAAAAVLVLTSAHLAMAQGAEAFAGEWRNRDKTNAAIVGANVFSENGRWMIQLLGSCTPNPCIWNPEPLVVLEPAGRAGGVPHGLATFQQSNMRRVMTFRLGEDTLVVEIYSMAAAIPSRGFAGRNYYSVDELIRTKAKAARLTSTRPR